MDPVVKKQWRNVGIYIGTKIALMYLTRRAILHYVSRNLQGS